MISLKGICLLAKKIIQFWHMFISSWTCGVSITRLPATVFNTCWSLMKIPAAPTIAGTALLRIPRRWNHFRFGTLAALGEVLNRGEEIFSLIAYGRVRTWSTALIAHPIAIFFVSHLVSPLARFFDDMGSFLAKSSGLLGYNSSSIEWKRWHVIFRHSMGPPLDNSYKFI